MGKGTHLLHLPLQQTVLKLKVRALCFGNLDALDARVYALWIVLDALVL